MKFDIDLDEVNRPLSKREKLGIWLLLFIFRLVMPCKYAHQLDAITKEIEDKLA